MTSFTRIGELLFVSCFHTGRLKYLCTAMQNILRITYDITKLGIYLTDGNISLEEYLSYRGQYDENTESVFFKTMDADGSGTIDWSEFLKHEACRKLARRDKVN